MCTRVIEYYTYILYQRAEVLQMRICTCMWYEICLEKDKARDCIWTDTSYILVLDHDVFVDLVIILY